MSGAATGSFKFSFVKTKPLPKQGLFLFTKIYFTTFTKIISSVNKTRDSMKANPKISAS